MDQDERLDELIATIDSAEKDVARLAAAIDEIRTSPIIDESELRELLKNWIVAMLRLDDLRETLRESRGW